MERRCLPNFKFRAIKFFGLAPCVMGLLLSGFLQVSAQSPVVYGTPGTYTFDVPACVTSITVQCWGAGGGGGGASEAGGGAAGAGGGGGGFATAVLTGVSGSFTVTVGGGGIGGIGTSSTGPSGTAGGNSSVSNGTVSVTAKGGGGGGGQSSAGVSSAVGAGGSGTFVGVTGTTHQGGNGGTGDNSDDNTGGAGGGGAGNAGNGQTPSAPGEDNNATGGAGGAGSPATAEYQGGAGGSVTAEYYENGDPGNTIGGGGGGGGGETSGGLFGHGTSPGNGGNGGNGQVIITYTTSTPTITSVTGTGCPGSTITITGTLLSAPTSVTIGSTAVPVISSTATTITGTVPSGATSGTVTVVNSCGTASSSTAFVVHPNIAVNLGTVSLCPGGSYTLGGHAYSTSGTYVDTASSAVTGCDSITTVTLSMSTTTPSITNQTICSGTNYSFGGRTYSVAGTYNDTLLGAGEGGCDSIATLNLSVKPPALKAIATSICFGTSFTMGDSAYTTQGIYFDTIAGGASNGCDSIIVLNLTVTSAAINTITDSICNGASYVFGDSTYTTPGTYTDTLPGGATSGCDSIVKLILYSRSASSSGLTASASVPVFCSGDSSQLCATSGFVTYLWNNGDTTNCFYTGLVGGYDVTATDANGCTAVSNHVNLSQHPVTSVAITQSGDTLSSYGAHSYQWFFNGGALAGDTLDEILVSNPGSYLVEITDTNGCHVYSSAIVIASGIQGLNANTDISIYPNPTVKDAWQVKVAADLEGSEYKLFDTEGRIIESGYLQNSQTQLPAKLLPGIYLLQVYKGGAKYDFKLIKL